MKELAKKLFEALLIELIIRAIFIFGEGLITELCEFLMDQFFYSYNHKYAKIKY